MKYEYTMGKELELKQEQEKTLRAPRLESNLILKAMYLTFDLFYGKARTLPKFMVLEVLARYPYWAWENGSYKKLSKLYAQTSPVDTVLVKDLLHTIQLGRDSQDNEQWHLLLLSDLIHQKGIPLGWVKHFLLPRCLAFVYYYLTRMIYFFKPVWSFSMNAAFESHAEHEYMMLVQENPAWEQEEVQSVYFQYYPKQKSLCDLLRRIALDERDHMNHSLEEVDRLTMKH